MAFCPNCGASNDYGSKFCPNCRHAFPDPGQQGGSQQNYGAPVGQISFGQRNIAVAIILSIVTCGIYSIIWFINMVDQVNEASGNQNAQSGGMVFLLSIVTCGIYQLVWFYKAGELIGNAENARRMNADSNASLLYLLLGIFGLSIVTYALIQNELNKIAEYHGAPKA